MTKQVKITWERIMYINSNCICICICICIYVCIWVVTTTTTTTTTTYCDNFYSNEVSMFAMPWWMIRMLSMSHTEQMPYLL